MQHKLIMDYLRRMTVSELQAVVNSVAQSESERTVQQMAGELLSVRMGVGWRDLLIDDETAEALRFLGQKAQP